MSRQRTCSLFAVLVVVILSACDSATEPDAGLSRMESETLFDGLFFAFIANPDPTPPTPTADGLIVPCPLGGQAVAVIEDSQMMAADTARQTTSIVMDLEACGVSTGGMEFTLDGSPNLRMVLNINFVGSTMTITADGSVVGGLAWRLDDRSGTCMIDLAYGVNASQPSATEISGTVCGHGPPFPVSERILAYIAGNLASGG